MKYFQQANFVKKRDLHHSLGAPKLASADGLFVVGIEVAQGIARHRENKYLLFSYFLI